MPVPIDPLRPPRTFTTDHVGVLIPLGEDPAHQAIYVAGLVVLMAAFLGRHARAFKLTQDAQRAALGTAHRWPPERTNRLLQAAYSAADWLTAQHAPHGHRFAFTDDGAFELREAQQHEMPQPKFKTKPAVAQVRPVRVPPGFHRQR